MVFSFQAGAVAFAVPCTLWPEGGLVFAVMCVWEFCSAAVQCPMTGIFMNHPKQAENNGQLNCGSHI